MNNNKLIIAFSTESNKFFAKLFCRKFKHCCVLFPDGGDKWTLVQIGTNGVRLVELDLKKIKIMKKHGWKFIKFKGIVHKPDNLRPGLLTCVGFAKRATGINDLFIWTPDQLYRKLTKI